MKSITLIFIILGIFIISEISYAATVNSALFEMTDASGKNFTIQLVDGNKIKEAREIISKNLKKHITGRIQKATEPYNPKYSFSLKPESIAFFEVSVEVCDSTISYVESHLSDVGISILPGNIWCPWSSRLVREIKTK